MPQQRRADAARTTAHRSDDHVAIGSLADELLPALIAKLGATGLGELEVREGSWRVRLRRPADGTAHVERRSTGSGRAQPGHPSGNVHPPVRASLQTNGASPPPLTPVGPGRDAARPEQRRADDHLSIASSPAVGVFRPRTDLPTGSRVRSGDRLGVVDMLGIGQEVIAPVDGILGARLVEAGDAVEYGQELIVIEFPGARPGDE